MMDDRSLLFVSIYYPPCKLVGGKRAAHLVDELDRLGSRVSVLTTKVNQVLGVDRSLACSGEISRVSTLMPFPIASNGLLARIYGRIVVRYLGFPDPFVGWVVPAFLRGLSIVRRKRVQVIVATGPPFTSFLLGAALARATGVGLVLDYRDPWTAYGWVRKGHPAPGLHRLLERWCAKHASALVFASQMMKDEYERHLKVPIGRDQYVITNGHHGVEPRVRGSLCNAYRRIVYAGTLYGERSVMLLVGPLLELMQDGTIKPGSVRIEVFGAISRGDAKKLDKLGARDLVIERDQLEYSEIIAEMKEADVLFLPSGSDVMYALPYKLFDYLTARRPILAVAPRESELARFMKELDCGVTADISNPSDIQDALKHILSMDGDTLEFSGVEKFSWQAIGQRYQTILDDVCVR